MSMPDRRRSKRPFGERGAWNRGARAYTLPKQILNLAKEFNDSELVFPSRPNKPLSQMSFLMVLRRMTLEDLTAHGFRATFKTWAEEKTKFDSLVIEAALAHQVKGIERHHLQTAFFEQRRNLMNAWATYATAAPIARVVTLTAHFDVVTPTNGLGIEISSGALKWIQRVELYSRRPIRGNVLSFGS